MSKINGDAKVILVKLENINEKLDDFKELHKEMFERLNGHSKSISSLKTGHKLIIGFGGSALLIVFTILIQHALK